MAQKTGLIEKGWLSYAEMVMPSDAPRVQWQECRRAFYAGAAHLLGAITDAVGPDDVDEDAGVAVLGRVQAEIDRHVRDVAEGRR